MTEKNKGESSIIETQKDAINQISSGLKIILAIMTKTTVAFCDKKQERDAYADLQESF